MWLSRFLALFIFWRAVYSDESCNLPQKLLDEIRSYEDFVDTVINEATEGEYSGELYDSLAAFIDRYGNRITGSQALELSIRHLKKLASRLGFNPILEPVKVPIWVRGKEIAYIITPLRRKMLKIMSLGFSGSGNVTGDLLVVKDFDELEEKANQVAGKVVLFNAEYVSYGKTVIYRGEGPNRASKLGAVAALIRSITPFSIGSRHTGTTHFDSGVNVIPAAAISLEDADMLDRLFRTKENVSINIRMSHLLKDSDTSYNFINDIPGSLEPNSYVTVSGHIDSWDVGQGALDDGGGAFLALHSLFLLKALEVPPPRRTFRSILWTAEEQGLVGAKSYLQSHLEELKNWTAAFESDGGLFQPLGFNFAGNNEAKCILMEIASLFKMLNTTEVMKTDSAGSDITVFLPHNVPLMEPLMVKNNYFWFHHSEGDSLRTLNPTYMDQHLALVTGTAYILANLSIPLPRANQTAAELLTLVSNINNNNKEHKKGKGKKRD